MEYNEGKLEKDMKEIKDGISTLRHRPLYKSREGLYVMTFIAMLGAMNSCEGIKQVLEKISPLELKTENVTGNSEPEKFYMVNGNRAYVAIDGQPVEGYAPKELPQVEEDNSKK